MPITPVVGRGLAILALVFVALLSAAGSAMAAADRSDPDAAQRSLQRAQARPRGRGPRPGRELSPGRVDPRPRRNALDGAGRRAADALLARPTDGNADPQGDGYTVTEAT